ncbi:MAG: hypothetical protein MZV70_61780 [Desulfobacterales bacterium]|nr:hypothetical protein [Desulfobacterales bacterium]
MLELKQTQRLSPVLTQQLQQAIKLLQLSRLELIEAIELEVQENPILELEEKEPKEETSEETSTEEQQAKKMTWLSGLSAILHPKNTRPRRNENGLTMRIW